MTRGSCERAALAAAAAWLCSAGYCPSNAQAQAAAAPASREATVEFDIAPQAMAAALNSWAVQANAQVFVDPGPVAHLMAPGVKGPLTPRQALRALLARSTLQVTQGANGVFVIKPRPTALAAQPPVTPASIAPERVAPVATAAERPTARGSAGPWLFGLAAEYTADRGTASGGATAALSGEYFITDHVAAALAVTAPRSHSFEVPGATGMPASRASARLQSSAASLKYYFAPESALDPYLGAGVELTALSDAAGVTGLERLSVGPALQAGLDFSLGPQWVLNAAIGWAQVRPDVATSPGRPIRLDPMQFGLGFVYRFGASR